METQARTKQSGSVINFLLVGIVLTAVVLGVIYFAHRRGQDSGAPSAPSVAVNPTSSSTASPSASASPSSSPKPSSSAAPSPSSSPAPTTVPSTGVLPTTGPTDDLLVQALPAALLLASAVAYVRSRRLPQATS